MGGVKRGGMVVMKVHIFRLLPTANVFFLRRSGGLGLMPVKSKAIPCAPKDVKDRMKSIPWVERPAVEVAQALQSRALSATTYVQACLDQIDQQEPQVHAFAHIARDAALKHAQWLDGQAIQGAMHGLTVGIKDVFDTYDMPTQGGSQVFAGYQPVQDAACIATLRKSGGVMLGKTITTELATFPTNGTRNPRHLDHTSGGSSSGSAAAIAANMVSFATGTQTMGSTIRPCGYCGVTGYKPTYNLVPKRGVWPNADSCDTVGLVARHVRDVAFLGAEMARYPELLIPDEAIAMDQRPTVGLCKTFEWDLADQHIHDAFHASARILEKAGAKVVEINLPPAFSQMLKAHTTVVHFEMSGGFMDILSRHADKMRPPLRQRSEEGLSVTGREYQAAQAVAHQCRALFDQVLGDCDVLFVPAATGEAPLGQDYSGDTRMNQVWTLMHGPCVSVTGGHGPHGLPLAMQVVGRINDDQRTLLAAHWIDTQLKHALGT